MRESCALVLLVPFLWIGGLVQDARAGVTIDVVFQDGTGHALTIDEGDPGPGCSFGGRLDGSTATGHCMSVVMYSTWDFIDVGLSVSYDSDNGLAVGDMYEWYGPVWWGGGPRSNWMHCPPAGGIADNGGIIQQFDCSVEPPVDPPEWLYWEVPAGTYRLGTIVWDTSATIPGTETIAAMLAGGDGVIAVINGNIVDVTSSVVVDGAILNIISEAVGVPSMGSTGVTVLGVAVFDIGVVGLVIAARRKLD